MLFLQNTCSISIACLLAVTNVTQPERVAWLLSELVSGQVHAAINHEHPPPQVRLCKVSERGWKRVEHHGNGETEGWIGEEGKGVATTASPNSYLLCAPDLPSRGLGRLVLSHAQQYYWGLPCEKERNVSYPKEAYQD